MLTTKQIKEIREFLEKSKKPLFIFDDDPDGLTSYLLLKKKYKKGERLCLKASPKSEELVIRAAVKRHNPDLVVFLDVPTLTNETASIIHSPIVSIDHHPPVKIEGVNYYNPMNSKKPDNRPTSYWAYRVTNENEWLAVIGIIADWHIPDAKTLNKFKHKKLLGSVKNKTPPQLIFDTVYGKLVKVWYFCMKGSNDEMNKYLDALEKIEDPLEIFEQKTFYGKIIYKHFERINKEYEELLNDALAQKKDDVFVYTYPGGKNSYTSILSNELLHRINPKALIIGREKEGDVRMSFRSQGEKPILPILKKAFEKFHGYGGGHPHACGGAVKMEDFPKFVEFIRNEYKKKATQK